MKLQYISDNAGNTTAVIVPIEEWNNILAATADLRQPEKPDEMQLKKKPSDFKGILTADDAANFHEYLNKARKEWDRNFY